MTSPSSASASNRNAAGWWPTSGVSGPALVDVPAEVLALAEGFSRGARVAPSGAILVALRELIDQLEAVWLNAAADFDAAGGPTDAGAVNLAGWMRATCRLAPADAASRARLAHTLPQSLPTTYHALRDGHISLRHAQVVEAVVRTVPEDQQASAEAALQEPARALDPMQLKKVGQHLVHRLDADRADEQALRRLARRGLTLSETFDGMVAVSGLLDPLTGATVRTAIESLVLPTRKDDTDTRSWAQRRADSLADICRQFLDTGHAPSVGGVRPHISVLVDLATLRREPGCPGADLVGGGAITAEQARLIACDASVSRILTDGPSQVIDVGRTTRTVPPAIRRALVARDKGCIGPGCSAAPSHCDAHHIVFWEDGGSTSLENLALLCRRHHTLVHTKGLVISTEADGSKLLGRARRRARGRGWPDTS